MPATNTGKNTKRWWIWIIVVVVLSAITCVKDYLDDNAPPELQTTAASLVSEYQDNEVAADQKFKGKSILVTGQVEEIGNYVGESVFVNLKSDGLNVVQCVFPGSLANEIAVLKIGQPVTIKGKCDGKYGNVVLRDSVIVK